VKLLIDKQRCKWLVKYTKLAMSGHVMSLRRRRFATVGCADGLVPTNALCLVRCIAD